MTDIFFIGEDIIHQEEQSARRTAVTRSRLPGYSCFTILISNVGHDSKKYSC
jgi:hypothetical protein